MHMMGIERILSSEHVQQKKENSTADTKFLEQGLSESDSFVVDIDNLSQVTLHDHQNKQFQRSLSRKVSSQRGVGNGGAENDHSSNKEEAGFVNGDHCVSANKLMGSTFIDLPQVATASNVGGSIGTTQNINGNQKGQQMVTVAAAESNKNSKLMKKKSHSKHHNQLKSSSQPRNWMMDPRRILLLFASLSSMGTIILIYFTLSIGKFSGNLTDA
ncbi:hypothetical protein MKW94_014575 [Papaver nudicaule]|uniref:Uncharacterized protein n=1 Tax=Papaver nudicaule TaxID=74823 RepID=A0AA41VNM1_PAPNU|nr:hypothetical protein [Papaver nudicaule]